MATEIPDLNDVEKRFRRVLDSYSNAKTRCDLLETLFGIHTALEDAFDAYLHKRLGFEKEEIQDLSFLEKARKALPGQEVDEFELPRLHGHRSNYAHPRRPYEPGKPRPFTNKEIKDTAVDLVSFASAIWRHLFGSLPPQVRRPSLRDRDLAALENVPQGVLTAEEVDKLYNAFEMEVKRLSKTVASKDDKIEKLQARLARKKLWTHLIWGSDIRWRELVYSVLALLPLPWIAGFGQSIWLERPVAWYWLLVPTGLFLALTYFATRSLWRFVHSVGTLRMIATISILLVVSTAVLTPFTKQGLGWAERAGVALAQVLDSVIEVVGDYTSTGFEGGDALAKVFLSSGGSTTQEIPITATYSPYAVPPRPYATMTVTRTVLPTPSDVITIGIQVAVRTSGARLRCRSEPGMDSGVEARFENGAILTIIDGPVEADGFVWWEVEEGSQRGWSAARFLVPLEDR